MKGNMSKGKLTMPKLDFGSKGYGKASMGMHSALKIKKTKFKSVLASAGV
jgi:hypothetical protein